MEAISYTTVRANLAGTMKRVCEAHEPVIVTRKSTDAVVILSLADYEALNETAYLLRSPQAKISWSESEFGPTILRTPQAQQERVEDPLQRGSGR